MKNTKRVLAGLVAAVMVFGMILVAADELPMVEKQDRFNMAGLTLEDGTFSMLSKDGELVINISNETLVVFEDGESARERLEGEQTLAELLEGRMLTVTYSFATLSLPAQTHPEKIVIMNENVVPLPEELINVLNGEIVVGGEIIDAPAPYYNEGVIMVPLRAIAEKMGFEVVWEEETESVRLGNAISLQIGKDYYTVGRMTPIELGAVPVLNDARTFVPLTFFKEVVTGYDAYAFEGQVVIEKPSAQDVEATEPMEIEN